MYIALPTASLPPVSLVEHPRPSLGSALLFSAKATALRAQHIARERPLRFSTGNDLLDAPLISESITQLSSPSSRSDTELVLGKIENLRIARRAFDSVEVPAGELFSFWAQLGRPSKHKGYVEGRELREGCIVPSIGGGLCQLSNALYDAALKAQFEIIERHAHSQVVAGSLAEIGRDATVFWNYIDLRFRAPFRFRIEADLDRDNLSIRFKGHRRVTISLPSSTSAHTGTPDIHDCLSCGVTACFRHREPQAIASRKSVAMLDARWPEFDHFVSSQCEEEIDAIIPMDGMRWKQAKYDWKCLDRCEKVSTVTLQALRRSLRIRRLPMTGASFQNALMESDREIANAMADRMDYRAQHLIIQQNYLPFLWDRGVLHGRTFDVLMTRLPMFELESVLDIAKRRHPQSRTLADFRAPEAIRIAERNALERVDHVITPHSDIAKLFDSRAIKLDWEIRQFDSSGPHDLIVFPSSALARKGAFEMRDAIEALDCQIGVLGDEIEEPGFWNGRSIWLTQNEWLGRARCVVLPAIVEHAPRYLLRAIGAGIPVIASRACGLEGVVGVVTIDAFDREALGTALRDVLD